MLVYVNTFAIYFRVRPVCYDHEAIRGYDDSF